VVTVAVLGSALGPLLFVIVVDSLSGEFRVTLPWELLCADDLVVIAETEDGLIKRLGGWRKNVENGGVGVDVSGTGVMVSRGQQKVAVGWPCGVCGGGIGGGSVQCAGCQRLVHRRCDDFGCG